jgi:hypothetical protein
MAFNNYLEREGATMNRKAGTSGLLWANGNLDALVIDAILTICVGLLALALAIVFVLLVMPLATL